MNAYELAEKLEYDYWHAKANITMFKSADMLRQQEDLLQQHEKHNLELQEIIKNQKERIAELEKDLAKYDELAIDDLEGRRIIWCDCGDAITQDSGAVCGVCASFRSTKEQSAEPVAWTNQKWLDGIAKEPQLFQPLFVHGKQTEHNTIPLYTAPRELSDEEIKAIANNLTCTPDKNWNVLFAKAILKKASEK